MCFNLWSPLADDLAAASRLVRALPGLPPDLCVTAVLMEHAPARTTHLNDATAFDAFIEYERPHHIRGFIGIETKLTEPFSRKAYEFARRYSRWMEKPSWWWREGSEAHFAETKTNQLWRDHMLTFAMLNQQDPTYTEAYCAVVYHDADSICGQAITAYRNFLRPEFQHTLLTWPLRTIVGAWETLLAADEEVDWLGAFQRRYLNLAASEGAWMAFCAAR